MNQFKLELLRLIDFKSEIDALIGTGKGTTRRCWNKSVHEDNDASLSYNPTHGGWRCHGCGESGDLFGLHMKVNGCQFWDSYKFYLQRYGLWDKVVDFKKSKFYKTKKKQHVTVSDKNLKYQISTNQARWKDKRNSHKLAFMFMRYGLNITTLERWKVCLGNDGRLWIPIWAELSQFADGREITHNLPAFVNVRKHDAFRVKAQWFHRESKVTQRGKPKDLDTNDIAMQNLKGWEPIWSERTGKVTSVKGHGSTYCYPAEVLLENSMVYLVGGELKALLMNQLGHPAVSFTTGEGSISELWLPYFIGKRVRVLLDADPEKDNLDIYPDGNPTAKKAELLAQLLADNGAIAEVCEWDEEVKNTLPKGGDITDLLRLCGWNPEAIDLLKWRVVERRLTEDENKSIPTIRFDQEKEPDWDKTPEVKFSGLVDPTRLNQWVKVRALVSGLNETPFVVPFGARVDCPSGAANLRPKCTSCKLPDCNFNKNVKFSIEAQVAMVGMPDNDKMIRQALGIPRKCFDPEIKITPASVQVAVLTPTVDSSSGSDLGERFEHRLSYLVGKSRIKVKENQGVDIKGRIIADPKKGTFTLSASEWREIDDDIFTHKPNENKDRKLINATAGVSAAVARDRLIGDVRDHVVKQIVKQEQMMEVIMISYFMPFVFHLNQHVQERVCPSVMIIGDTTVGKSTASNKIRRHFGAGKMYAANADPTHAGLIGGVMQLSNRKSSFHWGTVPTSHGAWLALDEYNKLSYDTIGKMTNVISSGVAERLTVSGPRRTHAWVRFLYLANPRGERSLTSYSNPLDAALYVCGSVQDLGRVDLVHVQYKLSDRKAYGKMLKPTTDHLYTKEVSRYHLQWAWSRRDESIKFDNPEEAFRLGLELSDRFGGHAVLLPAQARFKLARIAAAYAAMLFSHDDEYNLIVKEEHMALAADLIKRCYAPYLNPNSLVPSGMLPTELVEVFNKVRRYNRLRMLANSEKWSSDDLKGIFQNRITEFIDVAQYEFGIISLKRGWYFPKNSDFCEHVNDYLNERRRVEYLKKDVRSNHL
tara:strand:+ start:9087 stop:12215 length:3129 start_codon:yes stop_codon:yes gene_type:complete